MAPNQKSGEGGKLCPPISVSESNTGFTSQLIVSPWVIALWLATVICGCLGLFGIGLSTISAHSDVLHAAALPGITHSRSVRRKRQRQERESHPEDESDAADYSRYSSHMQDAESIPQQQAKIAENAASRGHKIGDDLQFADEAVSGTKLRRTGLDAMLKAAEEGRFKVLYFYSVSRLARESVITMPILKRLVHKYGVRVISVTEGLDSDIPGWEVTATILSLVSDRFIKELAESSFRGKEGAIAEDYSVGDTCYGFGSEPVPGSERSRRGGGYRPRMRYVIDPITAKWVRQIFHWFVVDKWNISQIVRELNKTRAPKPKKKKNSTSSWYHAFVVEVLSRCKYVGVWPWGTHRTVRDPETGETSRELRSEEECGKWLRHFPKLAIVDLDLFVRAQELLDENEAKYGPVRDDDGRLKGSLKGHPKGTPRHLIAGLIECGACGGRFIIGGTGSTKMLCPAYRRGECSSKTQLKRVLAEDLIMKAIGERIIASPDWLQAVYAACLEAWQNRDESIPEKLINIRREIAERETQIARLLELAEEGNAPSDLNRRIRERRAEIGDLRKSEARLKREQSRHGEAPTLEWVRGQVDDLADVLRGEMPAAAFALRDLVGGKIVVNEMAVPGSKRKTYRAIVDVTAGSLGHAAEVLEDEESSDFERIEIPIVDSSDGKQRRAARQMYEDDMLEVDIARSLGVSQSRVTALLKQSFSETGDELPDGRTRRSRLAKKSTVPAKFEQLADEVMMLYEKEMLLMEIAEALSCNRDTVTAAIRFWHESRGLPVPDGRTRRKSLKRKAS